MNGNMEKGRIVPKWVLIVRPKITQMAHNLFAKFFCPCPKVLDFDEKRLHWASVVRDCYNPIETYLRSVYGLDLNLVL